jgi:hypothetical protein
VVGQVFLAQRQVLHQTNAFAWLQIQDSIDQVKSHDGKPVS